MTFKPTEYLPYDFANRRHIGPSPAEMSDMLRALDVPSLAALMEETLPEGIRMEGALEFGRAKSEREVLEHLRITAAKNKVRTSLIGQG